MANLDDLNNESITSMSNDEAIELVRQIRLSRYVPTHIRKPSTKKIKLPKISQNEAVELLKLIQGE